MKARGGVVDRDAQGQIAALTGEALDGDGQTGYGRTLALEASLDAGPDDRNFHRDGEAAREVRKAWASAFKRAKLLGVLCHDLRCTRDGATIL